MQLHGVVCELIVMWSSHHVKVSVMGFATALGAMLQVVHAQTRLAHKIMLPSVCCGRSSTALVRTALRLLTRCWSHWCYRLRWHIDGTPFCILQGTFHTQTTPSPKACRCSQELLVLKTGFMLLLVLACDHVCLTHRWWQVISSLRCHCVLLSVDFIQTAEYHM